MSTSGQSKVKAQAPVPPVNAAPTSTISPKATLSGKHFVTLAARCMIHPFAHLESSQSPLSIGEGAIVWESAHVGAAPSTSNSNGENEHAAPESGEMARESGDTGTGAIMTVLDARAVVHANAVVESGARIGKSAVVEAGAVVGAGAIVGEYAKIAAGGFVASGDVVPAYTVVYPHTSESVEVVANVTHNLAYKSRGTMMRRTNETLQNQPQVRKLQDHGHEKHLDLLRRVVKGST